MIRIDASYWSGMNQIKSDLFLDDFQKTKYKSFFGVISNGSKTDLRMARNSSDSLGLNSNQKLLPGQSIHTWIFSGVIFQMPILKWYNNIIMMQYFKCRNDKFLSFWNLRFYDYRFSGYPNLWFCILSHFHIYIFRVSTFSNFLVH